MVDYLEGIDRSIVLAVNGWNTPFWDEVMWVISAKATWIPLYVLLLFLCVRQSGWKTTGFFVLCGILAVAIADQSSNHLFKELIQRYRPSHHAELTDVLHFHQFEDGGYYKGGMYGFISSHATNFFAICMFALLHLRKNYKWITTFLLFIAVLVSFSRLYLGVHYLSDLLAGALVGTLIGWAVHRFVFGYLVNRFSDK